MRIVLLVALPVMIGCAVPKPGVLVLAHGGEPAWNKAVEASVRPLRQSQPAEVAVGMASASTIQDAVDRLEEQGVRRIVVVPLFISHESFLAENEYILGLRNDLPAAHDAGPSVSAENHCFERLERVRARSEFIFSRRSVGDSPLVDEILLDRVRDLSHDPPRESVLILAHGPGDEEANVRWLSMMEARAARLREIGAFRAIRCETLREDWPEKRAAAERRVRQFVETGGADGGRVIVVPFRIAGFGPYREVLEGLNYVAQELGFCPHPNMARWIEWAVNESLKSR